MFKNAKKQEAKKFSQYLDLQKLISLSRKHQTMQVWYNMKAAVFKHLSSRSVFGSIRLLHSTLGAKLMISIAKK